jgi:phospholipid/cholesterol/gamma-HCH transport system substrate-binding protein
MIKTTPSASRLAGLLAFVLACVIVLTYLWVNFGGSIPLASRGYRVQVAFPQANELATGADVRISGVNVGKVVGLSLDKPDSRTLATLELSRQYAPIPRDTRATLRLKTLLGETYVALSTGNRSGGELPEGGRLADGQVQPDVALDQILSTFDPKTRRAWQVWASSQAAAVTGRGQDINASFGLLPGFFDSSQRLLTALNQQSAGVGGLVSHTGEFFNAISAQRGQLSGLITSANDLFQTTARRNQQLADVFRALPNFELQSRLALPALTSFARRSDPVVRGLQPLASELTQTFGLTAQLAPQFRALFQRLGPTVTASKRGLPAFDRILAKIPPLLSAFQPFLRNANPMVRYIGLFKPEVTGFFGNVTASAEGATITPRGNKYLHILRSSQPLTPSALAFYPRPLGIDRNDAYRQPGVYNQLASGLPTLDPGQCSNGTPAPPSSTTPPSLAQMVEQYVFRTSGRDVAAPPCRGQGPIDSYSTQFPHLTAEPPPSVR